MPHKKYIKELNDLFDRHHFGIQVSEEDLVFSNNFVTDAVIGDRRFTEHLTSAISQPIYTGEFYHYTGRDATNAILRTKTLRLTSVEKRITEDEIRRFLEEFGFSYPLSLDPDTGQPRYVTSISRQIFYTSFTDTTLTSSEEQYFWNTFAGADGARLKFLIGLQSGCLRRIVYGDDITKWALFFKEVNDLTQKILGKIFYWGDSATVCALHLPESYKVEREVRLITRRNCGLRLGNDGPTDYLELNFGMNSAIKVNLKLVEIQTDQTVSNNCGALVTPRT